MSVPSGRLLSKAGATANKKRNRLTKKRLSKLPVITKNSGNNLIGPIFHFVCLFVIIMQ